MKNISISTKGNTVRAFGAILKLVSILQQRVLAFILSLNSLAPSHGRSLCSHAIREEVKQKACSRMCFLLSYTVFANAVDAVTRMQTCYTRSIPAHPLSWQYAVIRVSAYRSD